MTADERVLVAPRAIHLAHDLRAEIAPVERADQRVGLGELLDLGVRVAQRLLELNDAASGIESRDQLGLVGGLAQIVVGAGVEARDDIVGRAVAGEQQHVEVGRQVCLAHPPAKRAAIHARHVPVREQQLIVSVEDLGQRLLAVGGGIHGVARALQLAFDQSCVASARPRRAGAGTAGESLMRRPVPQHNPRQLRMLASIPQRMGSRSGERLLFGVLLERGGQPREFVRADAAAAALQLVGQRAERRCDRRRRCAVNMSSTMRALLETKVSHSSRRNAAVVADNGAQQVEVDGRTAPSSRGASLPAPDTVH